ncbi:MAG TPA: hypothetical protein VF203_08310 [Burkholderiales bacterium]
MHRFLFAAGLALLPTLAQADVAVSGRVSVRDHDTAVDIAFTNSDKAVILDYYRKLGKGKAKHGRHVPPGLAKKGGLPPGLAKRDRLPRDVHYELLPAELEARLPPLPPNYVRVRVGQDFAILDKRTRVVLDVAIGLPI